jgi:ABC-type branched-subunit amino acid transport system ATPase component
MLRVGGIHAGYGDLAIIRDLTFDVASGEIVTLLGHNGVGKTTLLRAVMGLVRTSMGSIEFDGRAITNLRPHNIASLGIAYIPQESALFPDLTVAQNLRVAFRGRPNFEAACNRVFGAFPILSERFHQRAGTLSGGEQKMLLTARALLVTPRLILVDEVTEGVQPGQIDRIGHALHELNESVGTAMLIVEQHISFALGLARRFMVMKQGAITARGEVASSFARAKIETHLAL